MPEELGLGDLVDFEHVLMSCAEFFVHSHDIDVDFFLFKQIFGQKKLPLNIFSFPILSVEEYDKQVVSLFDDLL